MPEKPGGGLAPSGFGPGLRRVREEKGLTQKQLGEAAGVHPNTIAKFERGEIEPSWPMVLALGKALGVDCTTFAAAQDVKEGQAAPPAPAPEPEATTPPKTAQKRKGK